MIKLTKEIIGAYIFLVYGILNLFLTVWVVSQGYSAGSLISLVIFSFVFFYVPYVVLYKKDVLKGYEWGIAVALLLFHLFFPAVLYILV